MRKLTVALVAATIAQLATAQVLEAPILLMAGDAVINVEIGHAAPCVYDFDGDGRRDLLVGQFGEGKLRVYRNAGTDDEPEYGEFTWFEAGGEVATVPAG